VRYFDDAPETELDCSETTDAEHHGRIEVRRHAVSQNVGFLNSHRRYPGEPRFPGLKAIARLEAEVERDGKTRRERRYYLCSMRLHLPTLCAATGTSKSPALGARRGLGTSAACAPATGRTTWPPSGTWRG
jgi:hypothetical protein